MKEFPDSGLHPHAQALFSRRGWTPFDFQMACNEAIMQGQSGLLNAPTGSGKTLAIALPFLIRSRKSEPGAGIRLLWITPLRALARDTEASLAAMVRDLDVSWEVARRTGDSTDADRKKMGKRQPEVLITTPESLHIMLSRADYPAVFRNLDGIVIDEWHELMGTKRGVQAELALIHLRHLRPNLQIWGISATIGNLVEAAQTLGLGPNPLIIRSARTKHIEVSTLLPDRIEHYPWSGHIGIRLIHKVLPIIRESTSTLMFTNTRSMTEIWYQQLLEAAPDLAGQMAIHHGSLSADMRNWVEQALHGGHLKLVICTSSLDLGVDFTPVESVIQVGSPKGVARFLQRAGRSGHQPGATSRIWFLPTNALEIIDSVALQHAMLTQQMERREPLRKPLDVLSQFVCTLATGIGCRPNETLAQIRQTQTYHDLSDAEWQWILQFVTTGGAVLDKYDDYAKVRVSDEGTLHIIDRRTAMRHRLSIGTITSDINLSVKFLSGGRLGTIEETFVAKLNPGDVFLFAGRWLEFVRIKDLTVIVKKSASTTGVVSRWMGGRMPLSSQLARFIREMLRGDLTQTYPELDAIGTLLDIQRTRSHLPASGEFLIEQFKTREGWHHFFYPIEGRNVHEGLASLIAWRIGQNIPITFSIAMNDYGFELLSDQPVPVEILTSPELYHTDDLHEEVRAGINASEMAKRQFREIARVAGLVFSGYPGKRTTNRHLQANSGLLFEVIEKYDPGNLLISQSYDEIMHQHIEISRLSDTLRRIRESQIVLRNPERFTPLSFPIMVDRLRARMSTEKVEDRIRKMYIALAKKEPLLSAEGEIQTNQGNILTPQKAQRTAEVAPNE
jgi:ATP-dependent helicase Lhr and Lhr-like helicase